MKSKKQFRGLCGISLTFALLFSACQTYQIGGTLEPRPHANAQGVFFAGDWISENGEVTLAYFPESQPQESGISPFAGGNGNYGIGFDHLYKYPFHFAGNHFSIFPILGYDIHYFQDQQNSDSYNTIFSNFGIGIKFGGGFDISFTKNFFLRAKALYSPEIFSFLQNEPGLRLSVGLGYRTTVDSVRKGFKSFKTLQIDNAIKAGRENFDKKNYNAAVENYRKAIELGGSLGNTDITNLSASLYERAKENRKNKDYQQAIDDMNESMRHQYFMSRQKYSDWVDIIELYENAYNQNAPHGGYGKLIFPANDYLTITYDPEANEQNNRNEIRGTGWNLNLPAGRRVFSLSYNELQYDKGYRRSDSVRVTLDVEEGHIYQAEGAVSGSSVAITITDVTNSELGKDLDIRTTPIFSRILSLREERARNESLAITIVNNTGYTIKAAALSPMDSDDIQFINLGGNIRNGNSRRVTLPSLDTSKRYILTLMDTDDDFYVKFVSFIPNMSITFTFSDFYTRD